MDQPDTISCIRAEIYFERSVQGGSYLENDGAVLVVTVTELHLYSPTWQQASGD